MARHLELTTSRPLPCAHGLEPLGETGYAYYPHLWDHDFQISQLFANLVRERSE